MNMKTFLLFTITAAATLSVNAASFEDYARVIDVQERYAGSTPSGGSRTVCEPVQQAQSNNYGAGTALGAVAGGLVGSQVGKGNGRIAGAAVGAATGAMAGHYVEGRNQQPQQRCYQTSDGYSNGYRGSAGIHVKPSRNRLKCLSPLTFSTLSSLDDRPLQPGSQPN